MVQGSSPRNDTLKTVGANLCTDLGIHQLVGDAKLQVVEPIAFVIVDLITLGKSHCPEENGFRDTFHSGSRGWRERQGRSEELMVGTKYFL